MVKADRTSAQEPGAEGTAVRWDVWETWAARHPRADLRPVVVGLVREAKQCAARLSAAQPGGALSPDRAARDRAKLKRLLSVLRSEWGFPPEDSSAGRYKIALEER